MQNTRRVDIAEPTVDMYFVYEPHNYCKSEEGWEGEQPAEVSTTGIHLYLWHALVSPYLPMKTHSPPPSLPGILLLHAFPDYIKRRIPMGPNTINNSAVSIVVRGCIKLTSALRQPAAIA